ncbi:MAG: hypothetical protein ACODAQ_03505 [Phycisphaeraceae bacterium]
MSTLGRASAEMEPAAPRPAVVERAPEPAGGGGEHAWWSWSGVGVPIILRVPRGVAILAVVGLIGLLVLAYWVGHTRGEAAATATMTEQTRPSDEADHRAPPGPPPQRSPQSGSRQASAATGGTAASDTAGEDASPGGADVRRSARRGGDPREPGLNYFIVATYTADHAQRCAEFLAEQGVETHLVSGDNDRFSIWVVERGFTRQELYDSQVYRQWESRLKDLGRAWAAHNGNSRDTFASMYPAKYQGDSND